MGEGMTEHRLSEPPRPSATPSLILRPEDLPERVLQKTLIIDGQPFAAAELLQPAPNGAGEDSEVHAGLALIERCAEARLSILYAVPTSPGSEHMLKRLGFQPRFEVALRNLYLGIRSVSKRLDSSLRPVRSLAKYAMQVRQKLMEVELCDDWLSHAAALFDHRRPRLDFAVDRDLDYLTRRYAAADGYRLLVLRRRAGVGIDAFAIVKTIDYKPDRVGVQLIDHWTRSCDRKAIAWLLGELAVWSMAQNADVLQVFAAAHSQLEQTLVAGGCIRKKSSAPFMIKRLGPTPATAAELLADHTQLRAGDLAAY